MSKIKFIYFDVGGVVLLDFSGTTKWADMLSSMGVNEANRAKFDQLWEKHRDRNCIDYDIDWMLPELRDFVGLNLNDAFSFLQEFIKRFYPNPSIWPVITYAKQHYKIGLLTGQYIRMYDEICKKPGLLPDIDWDVIVDSSIVKMQKPNADIYDLAEKLAGVADPEEILFVDNDADNLVYPKGKGWQTFLYDPTRPIISSEKLSEMIH